MQHNHRCHLVLCCLSSKSHCRVLNVKFSLNPIPAQKMTNLENTVRRQIIIVLSLFILLIIRASIWMPQGKNLADPCQDQKDDQFAKYRSLNLRFDLAFWSFPSQSAFAAFSVKFSLNPISAQKMAGFQKILRRLIIIFLSSFFLVIIRALLLSSHGKNLAKPYYEPKNAQFARNFHTSHSLRSDLVFWCFP